MTTASDIARFTGPYNLPDGEVPVVDGTPRWPWDEAVARQRLARVARSAGLSLTGDEVFVESGSNDAWLLPDAVLRVCWRGDVDRLVRESELALVLPEGVPGPQILDYGLAGDYGRAGALSWMLSERHHATSLWHAWQSEPAPVLHDYVGQLADIMRRLHEWNPPAATLERYRAAEAPDTETDPVRIAASTLTPLTAAHLHRLIEHARDRPYVDAAVLDRIGARLSAMAAAGAALPVDRGADVLVHADCTPANVLIQDGRIIALLDFEWSRLGPRDIELTLPSFWAWVDGQHPDNGRPAIVPWLTEAYPALATTPERLWLYRTGFALRGLIHWPDYAPEAELPRAHPARQLRHLADTDEV